MGRLPDAASSPALVSSWRIEPAYLRETRDAAVPAEHGTKVRVKTMFYVPAIVSELTVGLSVKDRLRTAEALRVAKLAAEHRKVETRAERISRAVRSRLVLMTHALHR